MRRLRGVDSQRGPRDVKLPGPWAPAGKGEGRGEPWCCDARLRKVVLAKVRTAGQRVRLGLGDLLGDSRWSGERRARLAAVGESQGLGTKEGGWRRVNGLNPSFWVVRGEYGCH